MNLNTTCSQRPVVIWSGGYDSTVLLHETALASSSKSPVIALSIEKHNAINEFEFLKQAEARKAYINFSEKKGLHIDPIGLSLSSNADIGTNSLAELWLCSVFPYLRGGDSVGFGYIKQDDFWHYREHFCNAVNSLCSMRDINVTLRFPYEWLAKTDIIMKFKEFEIPDDCVYSCEKDGDKSDCDCSKCKESARALVWYEEYSKTGSKKKLELPR